MATNYVQSGDHIFAAIASKSSGDPAVLGQIPGVCLTDTDSSGNVVLATRGVFDLPVKGQGPVNPQAISVGDIVYWDATELNKDSTSGIRFGYALEAVSSGATTTIKVNVGW